MAGTHDVKGAHNDLPKLPVMGRNGGKAVTGWNWSYRL